MSDKLKLLFSQPPIDAAGSDDLSVNDRLEVVRHYHAETKHYFHRFARSLGYLDWATQPDPFRRFAGASLINLPFMAADDSPPYPEIYQPVSTVSRAVTLETLGQLFELSLAVSAWKQYGGTRWALRVNPSSGNLHPTEGYVVVGAAPGGPTGAAPVSSPLVGHYAANDHCLEVRARLSPETWRNLTAGFPADSFLVGLSSVHWREAWKYGERAFRYCQHDVGHALAALRLSAAVLGWRLVMLEELGDGEVAQVLGLDRDEDFVGAEREHPDLLAVVVPGQPTNALPRALPPDAISEVRKASWEGKANRLSVDHVEWEVIGEVAQACHKPRTWSLHAATEEAETTEDPADPKARYEYRYSQVSSARQIISQRRSAVALDARTGISARELYQILARTMPDGAPPWDAVDWPPCVDLCLFVHRIHELLPGLYILVRSPRRRESLRSALRPDFLWEKPPGCPEFLPLYFLREGNCQVLAAQVSCGQDIAGDGAFSLGMVAEFEGPLRAYGPWHYRRLFWETGMIGQVLYLEAEAAGVRGTGIGCFFDDPVHEVFGFSDWGFQSLYHFTLGGAVEDARLTTLPPYSEQQKRRGVSTR